MRRLFLIFMLLFLPLQVSMAAVCSYCEEQCAFEPGRESVAEPQSKADVAAKAKTALAMDAGCQCCHLGGIGVPAQWAAVMPVKPKMAMPVFAIRDIHSTTHSERPERPKWTRAS
jgi:hypothetical protein